MSYSTAQKLAFAGLVVGFILCVAGGISPVWYEGELTLNKPLSVIGENIPLLGDLKLAKLNGGLWWFCLESDIIDNGESKCYSYEQDNDDQIGDAKVDGNVWLCRISCVVCILVSAVCALTALCRQCCCSGGKTVFHGIVTFIAGAAGIVCSVVFMASQDDGIGYKLLDVKYGWSFYLFFAGSILMTVVSFALCFTSPNVDFRGMVMQHMPGSIPYHNMNQGTTVVHVTEGHTFPMNPSVAPVNPAMMPQAGYYPPAGDFKGN